MDIGVLSGKSCKMCNMGSLQFAGIEFINGMMHRKYECKHCGVVQYIPTNIFLGTTELKIYD